MDGAVEMVEVTKGLMGEEMPLQVAPGMFDVVQLGGVLWQPFDGQPGPVVESGARGLAGMNRTVPSLQRVPGPPPTEAPFLRITTLSRDFEIRSPVRASISSCNRGSVQFGRSETPSASTAETTESAARAFTGSGPGALRARRPATPSRANVQRQWRTLSGSTENASAIRTLDQPCSDSKHRRARSASARSDEPASVRESRHCSAVATTRGRPAMITPKSSGPSARLLPYVDHPRGSCLTKDASACTLSLAKLPPHITPHLDIRRLNAPRLTHAGPERAI